MRSRAASCRVTRSTPREQAGPPLNGATLRIDAAARLERVPITLNGDLTALETPATARVRPAALRIFAP
jgi:hypothetical protein